MPLVSYRLWHTPQYLNSIFPLIIDPILSKSFSEFLNSITFSLSLCYILVPYNVFVNM